MKSHVLLRWPQGKLKALTLSYDDGDNNDKKMIEIMNRYGIKGTFNLCNRDNTNERYVRTDEYEELYKGHEIAVHGKYHVSGASVPTGTFAYDMIENRKHLEEVTDSIIQGMAYANGSFDDNTKKTLKLCGIKYGRTTKSTGTFDIPADWLALNPTCHHKREDLFELCDEFLAIRSPQPPEPNWRRLPAKLFYMWGHSYEFDRTDSWDRLEEFCRKMSADDDIWYATNIEIYNYVQAFNKLEFNLEVTEVYNPTATDIWFRTPDNDYVVKAGERMVL